MTAVVPHSSDSVSISAGFDQLSPASVRRERCSWAQTNARSGETVLTAPRAGDVNTRVEYGISVIVLSDSGDRAAMREKGFKRQSTYSYYRSVYIYVVGLLIR
jgi:hypothetical protein